MYVKYQCKYESEYESTWEYTFQQKGYKYTVIAERDLILHEYYITKRYKYMNYKKIYKVWTIEQMLLSNKKNLESRSKGAEKKRGMDKQLLIHHAPAAPL